MYPQTYYGQPSYAAPSFSHPPALSAGYYQPPPPPPPPVYHHVDPVTFRRDYTTRLAELTFNSRPIIQNLSMIAQEYSRFAEIVAQCLEAHIRRVPPWMKLPAFYLLDAISKNVYEPYARQFAGFVIPLFLEAYAQVDESTRGKMEEMLLTWRTGSPTGNQLFGISPQVAIERGVWGDGSSSHTMGNNFSSGSGQVTKSQVLSELEFTLGQKERAVQSNPYDTTSQNHINVLQQLRKLIQNGVSQDELQQILTQLRSLVRPPPPPAPAPTVSVPAVTTPPSQWPSYPPQQPPFPPTGVPSYPQASSYSFPPYGANVKLESVAPSLPPPPSTPIPSTSTAPPTTDIASLLSSLVKAGVVTANGTPVGAGATAREEETKVEPPAINLERESARVYRQSILAQDIKLTTSDITKKHPQIVEFLYNQLPAQCKQCGIRFADSVVGKKAQEDHLDMHFRQNRKANQNIGRGHSRSWFVGVEDWISDLSSDVKGKGRAGRPLSAKAAAAAEQAKREAELRAMFVVVPPGDEAKPVSCPICKEPLKSEFLEDDEDWVWKNAVMKDDRVFHATCHAEASSATSLAARLRSEFAATASRSRSGTPETINSSSVSRLLTPPPHPGSALKNSTVAMDRSLSHSPSPTAGIKRKADDCEDSSTISPGENEVGNTPPFKKIALSTTATTTVTV